MRNRPDLNEPDEELPLSDSLEGQSGDNPPAEMVDRYWLGHASHDDLVWLERWSDKNPERIERLTRVGEELNSRGFTGYAAEARADRVASILEAAQISNSSGLSKPSYRKSRRFIYGAVTAVASALLLITGWQAGLYQFGSTLSAQHSVYTTPKGERANITLPDGSKVVLNVDSRLEVPSDYMSNNRTLKLDGEGYFTVKQNTRAPFSVVAGSTVAKVLGTEFAVRNYEGDSIASVSVKDGRVAVEVQRENSVRKSPVIVGANQAVSVSNLEVSGIEIAPAGKFSFASGVLTLKDLSLSKAIPEMNRWYNADIRLGDKSIAQRRVEGRFVAGSIGDLAEILEWTFGLKVVREGPVLTLYPKAE